VRRDVAARIAATVAVVAVFLSMYVVAAVLVAIILFGLRVPPPRLGLIQVVVLAGIVVGEFGFRGPRDGGELAVFLIACGVMAALSGRRAFSSGRATS
jgi:hypothetical protein